MILKISNMSALNPCKENPVSLQDYSKLLKCRSQLLLTDCQNLADSSRDWMTNRTEREKIIEWPAYSLEGSLFDPLFFVGNLYLLGNCTILYFFIAKGSYNASKSRYSDLSIVAIQVRCVLCGIYNFFLIVIA